MSHFQGVSSGMYQITSQCHPSQDALQSHTPVQTGGPDGHRLSAFSRTAEGPSKAVHGWRATASATLSCPLHIHCLVLALCFVSCKEPCAHLQERFPLKEPALTPSSQLPVASASALKYQRFFPHLEEGRA